MGGLDSRSIVLSEEFVAHARLWQVILKEVAKLIQLFQQCGGAVSGAELGGVVQAYCKVDETMDELKDAATMKQGKLTELSTAINALKTAYPLTSVGGAAFDERLGGLKTSIRKVVLAIVGAIEAADGMTLNTCTPERLINMAEPKFHSIVDEVYAVRQHISWSRDTAGDSAWIQWWSDIFTAMQKRPLLVKVFTANIVDIPTGLFSVTDDVPKLHAAVRGKSKTDANAQNMSRWLLAEEGAAKGVLIVIDLLMKAMAEAEMHLARCTDAILCKLAAQVLQSTRAVEQSAEAVVPNKSPHADLNAHKKKHDAATLVLNDAKRIARVVGVAPDTIQGIEELTTQLKVSSRKTTAWGILQFTGKIDGGGVVDPKVHTALKSIWTTKVNNDEEAFKGLLGDDFEKVKKVATAMLGKANQKDAGKAAKAAKLAGRAAGSSSGPSQPAASKKRKGK